MKRTPEEIKKQTEEWLDEKWRIANMDNARPQDMSYYDGAIEALVFAGYDWEREAHVIHVLNKKDHTHLCMVLSFYLS